MACPVVRRTIGLLAVATLALLSMPLLGPADAESRGPVASPPAQITFATTTLPRTTTTARATTTTPPTTAAITTTTAPPATLAPTTTLAPATVVTTVPETTTTAPPPSTTVASIPAPSPPPVTLPLGSASQSGSIGAIFPILGGIGLFSLAALLVAQWFLTKPGRRGPTL